MKEAACILVLFAAGLGCGKYESCDPDQDLRRNVCFTREPLDAAPVDVGPGSCDGGLATSTFGEACASDMGCGCGTDVCAKPPGQPTGFCSKRDCLKDPSVCPKGWTCRDFSSFEPGFSMCVAG
jgi:hypothetical protein